MKTLLTFALLIFTTISIAEYKVEEIDDSLNYKVDYEVEKEHEGPSKKSIRDVAAEVKKENRVEEQKIEKDYKEQSLPFWDFKKEKF
jgi:hypothetical protein